jgi:hypothetical protein
MKDLERRVRALEARVLPREDGQPTTSDTALIERLTERLEGVLIDAMGERHPDPDGGWLDANGEVRADLPPEEQVAAREVLALLALGAERAREHGDD